MRGFLDSTKKYKKLNFGCGMDKRKGYLNVDMWPDCKPDLLIKDNDYSKIPTNHFDEMLANDVLEHIGRPHSLSALLDWARYLKHEGVLHLQTSSILGVAKQLQKNKSFAVHFGWTICFFRNQVHDGDFHHVGFTELSLRVHLLAAGFEIDNWDTRDKWLFSVDAHKASDWTKVIRDNKHKSDEHFTHSLFAEAFGREPDDLGGNHIRQGLAEKRMSRLEAAKHIYQSPERLYYTAKLHGCL